MTTKPKPSRIWGRVPGCRVLVFGDLSLEKYRWLGEDGAYTASATLPSPSDEVRPGGAAAVAAMASALGAETSLAGVVGDDQAGHTLLRLLDEARVDRSLVNVSQKGSTGIVERTITPEDSGDIVRVSPQIRSRYLPFSPSLNERLPDAVLSEIDKYDLLLVFDNGEGACKRTILDRLFASSNAENVLVCADALGTRDYSRYRGASLLKISRARAEVATERRIVTSEDALEAGRDICRRWGFLMTVITLGCEGMALVEAAGDQIVVPTIPLEVFERSGAREISLAVIGIGLATGACGTDAIGLANLAAGLALQKLGVKPISHQELYQKTLTVSRDHAARSRSAAGASRARREAEKQVTLRRLFQAVAVHREHRRKIGLAIGRFERIDANVVAALEDLSERGDVVIAGILGDEAATNDAGTFGADSRARMLGTVPWVDYVAILGEHDLDAFLRQLRPDGLTAVDEFSRPHAAAPAEEHGGEAE